MSNPGLPNSKAHSHYYCALILSSRSYREEMVKEIRIDKLLEVERKERKVKVWQTLSKMMISVRIQRGTDGVRGRIESLSQKPKLEKVSSQISRRVMKSIQSFLRGKDVLIRVNIEEPWVTRNPSVCRCPGFPENLGGRVRVNLRGLVGAGLE